jgi:hypothetical protein
MRSIEPDKDRAQKVKDITGIDDALCNVAEM